mmetsp:Transcript_71536/g.165423  ORF Transcript_71536/g.165423 Transcript_71536/m.165423 type:complete len:360 (-) Transcript_71536:1427-2506(-)
MVPLWKCVRRAVQIWCLSQGLLQQRLVRPWSRPVLHAPDGEQLHLLRWPCALERCHLLRQETWEGHNGAEEDHAGNLFGDDIQQRSVKRNASTLSKANEHDILPLQLGLPKLGLYGLNHGPSQELNIVEHVQVLILERAALAHVPRTVHHLRCRQVELQETLTGRVRRPGERHQTTGAQIARDTLQYLALRLGVVTDPHDERRGVLVPHLQRTGQRTFRAHGSHALIGEEQVQPFSLQLVALILLLFLLNFTTSLRRAPGRLLPRFLPTSVFKLFLQSGEDEHNRRAVCGICCAKEGIADQIFAHFVQDSLQGELVRTHQLREVFHYHHQFPRVCGELVDPARNVETDETARPCPQQGR